MQKRIENVFKTRGHLDSDNAIAAAEAVIAAAPEDVEGLRAVVKEQVKAEHVDGVVGELEDMLPDIEHAGAIHGVRTDLGVLGRRVTAAMGRANGAIAIALVALVIGSVGLYVGSAAKRAGDSDRDWLGQLHDRVGKQDKAIAGVTGELAGQKGSLKALQDRVVANAKATNDKFGQLDVDAKKVGERIGKVEARVKVLEDANVEVDATADASTDTKADEEKPAAPAPKKTRVKVTVRTGTPPLDATPLK